jgi:hypothetical protein
MSRNTITVLIYHRHKLLDDLEVFRGKNMLPHEILPLLDHLRKVFYGFLCNRIYPLAATEFLAVSSMASLDIQGVKDVP